MKKKFRVENSRFKVVETSRPGWAGTVHFLCQPPLVDDTLLQDEHFIALKSASAALTNSQHDASLRRIFEFVLSPAPAKSIWPHLGAFVGTLKGEPSEVWVQMDAFRSVSCHFEENAVKLASRVTLRFPPVVDDSASVSDVLGSMDRTLALISKPPSGTDLHFCLAPGNAVWLLHAIDWSVRNGIRLTLSEAAELWNFSEGKVALREFLYVRAFERLCYWAKDSRGVGPKRYPVIDDMLHRIGIPRTSMADFAPPVLTFAVGADGSVRLIRAPQRSMAGLDVAELVKSICSDRARCS